MVSMGTFKHICLINVQLSLLMTTSKIDSIFLHQPERFYDFKDGKSLPKIIYMQIYGRCENSHRNSSLFLQDSYNMLKQNQPYYNRKVQDHWYLLRPLEEHYFQQGSLTFVIVCREDSSLIPHFSQTWLRKAFKNRNVRLVTLQYSSMEIKYSELIDLQ